jgi:heme-degrading monooxygenase HmoA
MNEADQAREAWRCPTQHQEFCWLKFETALSLDEVKARAEQRMPDFRALPGLVQKYYCHEPATGEVAGVYLWDSHESLKAYLASSLRESIPAAYEIKGSPRIEVFDVVAALRDAPK